MKGHEKREYEDGRLWFSRRKLFFVVNCKIYTVIITVTAFIIVFAMQGCYCFYEGSAANVRYLSHHTYSPICEWGNLNGRTLQFNGYYGFPKTDVKHYSTAYLDNTTSDGRLSSFGVAGFRAEKYVTPFGIIPYTVLGLGLDYSTSALKLSYKNTINNNSYSHDLNFSTNRVMLSANYITIAYGRFMNYVILQGGYNFTGRKKSTDEPGFCYKKVSGQTWQCRIGSGFQYYVHGAIALVFEGGYGGGCYFKTGLCCWL